MLKFAIPQEIMFAAVIIRKLYSNIWSPLKSFGVISNRKNSTIDKIGKDLTISAKSIDGVIEGIETTSSWEAIGIQWHPEDLGNDI